MLMRESVGRIHTQLVQGPGSGWRVVVLPDGAQLPAPSEIVALVHCWLARLGLREAIVGSGQRTVTVRSTGPPPRLDPRTAA